LTSFVAWVGVDSHGPASIYLASDSRISWTDPTSGTTETWDYGRKVFASQRRPELLGYVGDVVFPSLVLSQLVAAVDGDAMFANGASPGARFDAISDSIKESFRGVPARQRRSFSVLYATREAEKMSSRFFLWALHWTPDGDWQVEDLPMPAHSAAIRVLGSGGSEIRKWQGRWDSTGEGRTSRAVFSSLCDAIVAERDPCSGGAPQLAGIYRIGSGRSIGVVVDKQPFLFGLPVSSAAAGAKGTLEWRNHLFERCDANGLLLPDAERHAQPRGLGRLAP